MPPLEAGSQFRGSNYGTLADKLNFNDLEKVQMRATKLVLTFKHLSYRERIKRLKLFPRLNTYVQEVT